MCGRFQEGLYSALSHWHGMPVVIQQDHFKADGPPRQAKKVTPHSTLQCHEGAKIVKSASSWHGAYK